MKKKEIVLPRKLVNELLHCAQATQDEEVCGFVSKNAEGQFSCYHIDNIAEQPSKRFLMDPEKQIAAIKSMRSKQEEVFAIYHSHPTAPAIPSAMDIEQAEHPNAYYLIISLNTKGVLEMRCFELLHDENIVEVNLRMQEK